MLEFIKEALRTSIAQAYELIRWSSWLGRRRTEHKLHCYGTTAVRNAEALGRLTGAPRPLAACHNTSMNKRRRGTFCNT